MRCCQFALMAADRESPDDDGYHKFIKDDTAVTYGSNSNHPLEEMGSISSLAPQNEAEVDQWENNYHEAAIFLEEGENNEKFDSHPKNHQALPPYLLVHNQWYYGLDLTFSIVLLALALAEKPSIDGFELPVGVHGTIELLSLGVIAVELGLKLRWIGWTTIFKHKRTLVKCITLIIMLVEAVAVLVRQTSHFRVTRALRPIFLVDTRACGAVRRYIRQILQSLPPILDMLILLLFIVCSYALLGYFLFSGHEKNLYFRTLGDSFVSMFVLLTTANFPDVMMPSYAISKWNAVFFISYISMVLYVLMNLMLAVVYETFTAVEKEKFRKLLLHKRTACKLAHRLLVSRQTPDGIRFRQFHGLMRYYLPQLNILIIGNGLTMFIRVLESSVTLEEGARNFCASWDTFLFIGLFLIEALLKIVGLGWSEYISSGWNFFDLSVTLLALWGALMLLITPTLTVVVILRPLRLLRVFKLKKRYRDIFGTLVLLSPLMCKTAIVMMVMYYFFAIIGMELFSEYDLKDCCVNSTVEDFYHFTTNATSSGIGYYYLNNFSNLLTSGITLFELTVVNNWFIIMDAYASVSNPYSRLFFMLFYLLTMVVVTIVVASVLEAFRFRIQYKKQTSKRDEEQMLQEKVTISMDCLHTLIGESNLREAVRKEFPFADTSRYVGRRRRTRDVLQRHMYAMEIAQWLHEAQQNEIVDVRTIIDEAQINARIINS